MQTIERMEVIFIPNRSKPALRTTVSHGREGKGRGGEGREGKVR